MNQVTKYIERFLCVLTPAAEIKVIQLDEVTAIDGTPIKSEQVGASSVTDPQVSALLEAISAKTLADLTAERAALATMTADRGAQKTIADTVPGLQSQITELTAAKAELEAEVARLTALVPPPMGPRELTPREFLARISDQDKLTIWNSDDPRCAAAMWELFAATSINLDSPVLAGMIDMLIEAGVDIDETERARIFA